MCSRRLTSLKRKRHKWICANSCFDVSFFILYGIWLSSSLANAIIGGDGISFIVYIFGLGASPSRWGILWLPLSTNLFSWPVRLLMIGLLLKRSSLALNWKFFSYSGVIRSLKEHCRVLVRKSIDSMLMWSGIRRKIGSDIIFSASSISVLAFHGAAPVSSS